MVVRQQIDLEFLLLPKTAMASNGFSSISCIQANTFFFYLRQNLNKFPPKEANDFFLNGSKLPKLVLERFEISRQGFQNLGNSDISFSLFLFQNRQKSET